MSTDKKSHWASLASVIGAKVPPEPAAPASPPPAPQEEPAAVITPAAPEVAATPVPAAPVATAPTSKPPAKTKARDNWGKVLGALGLRAPEPEPEPEPEPPAPAPVAVASPPAPIVPTSSPSLPKNLWELLGDKPPEATLAEQIQAEMFVTEVGGNDLVLGEDDDSEDEEEVDRWKSPSADPLRSSIPADRPRRRDEEASGDRPRRRRRRRRRGSEAGVESTEERAPRSESFAPVNDRLDDDSHDDDFAPVVDDYDHDVDADIDVTEAPVARKKEEASEDRPRRRRRRRRGRGRGADSAAEPTSATEPPARSQAYADEDEDVEDDADYLPAPTSRREPTRSAVPARGRRSETPSSRVPASNDLDEEDDDDVVDHGEHRSIPTWQDAIGLVVGANMEARAKNPGGNRGGRGRGGRGRGGRGRS